MFNTLIVTADLETGPGKAMGVAQTLARRCRLPVEVLTVVPPHHDRDDAVRREPMSDHPVGEHVMISADNVAAAIVEQLRGREGALLVMATSAIGLVSGRRRSVTGDVLAELVGPVLLLGPLVPSSLSFSAPTLVAGIDSTYEPPPALPVVVSWQQTFGGGRPFVVDVIAPSAWPAGSVDESSERQHADAVTATLAERGVDAVAAVLHDDDPVSSLLAFADGLADPVFVMTSDRWAGGPSHWYSTTRWLLQRSSHPVLVVPSDMCG